MKIKICGMRDPENIRAVAALTPDFMGFIFYGKSPRRVGVDFEIPPDFPIGVKKVGVFVNASLEEVMAKVNRHKLDVVQLQGEEPPQLCAEVKRIGVGVIKVFSVDQNFDFSKTHLYGTSADYFLFDTKGNNYGGNGVTFDWNVLKKYDLQIPFFLSGGLSLENIKNARTLKLPNMIGFDFNSGIEISPGIKDLKKVTELFVS